MAKKKKTKIGFSDLLMMIMALVGLVLAVVGICVPFFSQVSKTAFGNPEAVNMGLFDDYDVLELLMDGGLTIGLVQGFAIASLALTAIASITVILGKLGVIKFKGIVKLISAIIVIVIAALVITFAASYAAQSPLNVDGGDIASTSFIASTGAYLVMAGGVVSGVALLVSRLK